MKKIYKFFIPVLLIIISFSSCIHSVFNCIRGNNTVVSEIRQPTNFNTISSSGDFSVYINVDTVNEVEVKAESNIMQYIETYTTNQVLHIEIDDNQCININKDIKIYIKTTNLEMVELLGSGLIDCPNIETADFAVKLDGSGDLNFNMDVDMLKIDVTGSGDMVLSGTASKAELNILGSGDVRALNLEQDTCFVVINGSGDIYIDVNDLLDVQILGSGNIYYTGDPQLNLNILGTGEVIKY